MVIDPEAPRAPAINQRRGHYESWFLRGNHPTRPLAFWLRYTLTQVAGSEAVRAECFAIVFDGERQHIATREVVPTAACDIAPIGLDLRLGPSHLRPREAVGQAASGPHRVAWELCWTPGAGPMMLLPERLYRGGFPKAKALVMDALVRFSGALTVDGERLEVNDWLGSTNHNWGSRHTDAYAWGQVMGFPSAPDTALEVASARLRIGPWLTPAMTPVVLRHRGRVHHLNALHTVFGRAELHGLTWNFRARGDGVALEGAITARPDDVVTLDYLDPSGKTKLCVNTKLARCALSLTIDGRREALETPHGAAFELLVDDLAAAASLGLTGLPPSL
jgi:hypothetical protein